MYKRCYKNDPDLIFLPENPGSAALFLSTERKVSLASRYDGLPFAHRSRRSFAIEYYREINYVTHTLAISL
ncbi:hypothetical protein PANT111_160252 [Pantoea brenneri]|uniref:Uncharacterized protein n=1 Tax=Pantoea brenneri TaxID=472694 RepID=A0AAX3J4G4_9GAMM|nr:hypothetical protein PANT111_160252 [Pantoea brenneri]